MASLQFVYGFADPPQLPSLTILVRAHASEGTLPDKPKPAPATAAPAKAKYSIEAVVADAEEAAAAAEARVSTGDLVASVSTAVDNSVSAAYVGADYAPVTAHASLPVETDAEVDALQQEATLAIHEAAGKAAKRRGYSIGAVVAEAEAAVAKAATTADFAAAPSLYAKESAAFVGDDYAPVSELSALPAESDPEVEALYREASEVLRAAHAAADDGPSVSASVGRGPRGGGGGGVPPLAGSASSLQSRLAMCVPSPVHSHASLPSLHSTVNSVSASTVTVGSYAVAQPPLGSGLPRRVGSAAPGARARPAAAPPVPATNDAVNKRYVDRWMEKLYNRPVANPPPGQAPGRPRPVSAARLAAKVPRPVSAARKPAVPGGAAPPAVAPPAPVVTPGRGAMPEINDDTTPGKMGVYLTKTPRARPTSAGFVLKKRTQARGA